MIVGDVMQINREDYIIERDYRKKRLEEFQEAIQESLRGLSTEIIGELVDERERQNLTQKDVADITGILPYNLARFETGTRIPTLMVLEKYASALDKHIEIDYIDESEVLSPADDIYHIDKTQFNVPFVCGARDLGEALRRINEGASMIRTKGEPGTGDVVQAVRHMRKMNSEIRKITSMQKDELFEEAKQLQVPYDLVLYVHDNGRLPVVNFAAGGVATPADAALMMQLGAEGVFVGSGIFKSGNPAKRASAIVQAVTNYQDAALIARLSEDLGEAMVGINPSEIQIIMEERGR